MENRVFSGRAGFLGFWFFKGAWLVEEFEEVGLVVGFVGAFLEGVFGERA